MKDEKLVIAGVGFRDIINLIDGIKERNTGFNFIGFVDDNPEFLGSKVLGYPVLGGFDWLKGKNVTVFNSVAKTMVIRAAATQKLFPYVEAFASLVHPSVNTKYSLIGKDVAIFENVFLGPNTKIGSHTIIHTGCIIAHDVSIGENCFIAPGAQILGGVKIGDNSFIGANSVCMPMVTISDGVMIGALSLVTCSVPPGLTMLGVPAVRVFSAKRQSD
jgi:UDP-perosamine 4-acetyltransferase